MALGLKTKAADPVLCLFGAYRLQNANRHHIFRFSQSGFQWHDAFEFAVVVFRLPCLATGDAGIKKQRRIIDLRGGCEAFFQSGRVNEGLEARTWLTPRLGDMVEFVFVEIKTANQRTDRTVRGVQCHKRAFDFGQLGQRPIAFGVFSHPHNGTRAQFDIGWCFVGQARLHGFQTFARDFQHLAVLPHDAHFFRGDFQHHSGEQIAFVASVDQGLIDGVLLLARVDGQGDEFFRSTVDLT